MVWYSHILENKNHATTRALMIHYEEMQLNPNHNLKGGTKVQ